MPMNEKLKKAWKDNIRRAGDMPRYKSIVLCWEHFTEECLERNFKAEFESGNNDPVYKIKKDAIPTVFSYTKASSRTSSERRAVEKERVAIVTRAVEESQYNESDVFDMDTDSACTTTDSSTNTARLMM